MNLANLTQEDKDAMEANKLECLAVHDLSKTLEPEAYRLLSKRDRPAIDARLLAMDELQEKAMRRALNKARGVRR
tara:strand:+ start:410 stop:634 length:225 start_codon:yes stop_codon:yes gene_type:complete